MAYRLLEWLHLVSSAILFGAGFCSLFYLALTSRSRSVPAIAAMARNAVIVDWLLITPTAIVQPVSGFALAHLSGYPRTAPWLVESAVLYGLAVACWLPAVWLQLRMAALADNAWAEEAALPMSFWRYHRIRMALGVVFCVAFAAIFYVMAAKPR